MIGRMAMVAVAIGLAACAGLEPAGRNANRSPAASTPTPRVAQPAPTPAQPPPAQTSASAAPAPTTPPARQPTQPPVAAPQVTVPTPAPQPARARSDDDDIVVPGQVQTQVPPPAGDPRTNEERRGDIRAWDQCLMQVQSAFDADPMNPQLTSPEEYCSTSLGMAERTAVPIARQQPRRR